MGGFHNFSNAFQYERQRPEFPGISVATAMAKK
jgi:hypothetical protein